MPIDVPWEHTSDGGGDDDVFRIARDKRSASTEEAGGCASNLKLSGFTAAGL